MGKEIIKNLRYYILKKRLQFLYIRFLLYVRCSFNLKIPKQPADTKENLEQTYIKTCLLKVLEHGKAIVLLTFFGNESSVKAHPRILLETLLQARLLRIMDTDSGYRSFWYFADYSRYKNLENYLSNNLRESEEKSRKTLVEQKELYDESNVETKYITQLEHFKHDFKKKFPSSNIEPKKNKDKWAGLSNREIVSLFPKNDGGKELYDKLYCDLSYYVHPNPVSNVQYVIEPDIDYRFRGGCSSLIMGLNISIWIAQLYQQEKQTEKLQHFMNTLDKLLMNY